MHSIHSHRNWDILQIRSSSIVRDLCMQILQWLITFWSCSSLQCMLDTQELVSINCQRNDGANVQPWNCRACRHDKIVRLCVLGVLVDVLIYSPQWMVDSSTSGYLCFHRRTPHTDIVSSSCRRREYWKSEVRDDWSEWQNIQVAGIFLMKMN